MRINNLLQLFSTRSSMEAFLSIFFSFIFTTISFRTSIAADTLAFNQSLRDTNNETLVSSNGKFELGFFSPGNSTNRYLGIWFRNIPVQTVVWVANKNHPLTNFSGAVIITEAGNIVIYYNQSEDNIWSSDSSTTSSNPMLQLLDTGNLVVRDSNFDSNLNNYIWESFNYPCDTLIEGMKQGWNLKTGQNWYLTSWKGTEDPSTGDYTFKLDPVGLPEINLCRGSEIIYRKGPYDGVQFGGGPRMKNFPVFKPIFVYNETYDYYAFEDSDDSITSRFVVQHQGLLEHLTWSQKQNNWLVTFTLPRDHCDTYSKCGPNGFCNEDRAPFCHCPIGFVPKAPEEWHLLEWSSGCIRKTPRNCCGMNEAFRKFTSLKLPANSYIMENNTRMNQKECEEACLGNCSCAAYTITKISSCVMWFGDLMDVREYSAEGQQIYIRMAASDVEPSQNNKWIAVSVSIVFGFLALVSVGCYVAWKRNFIIKMGQIMEKQHHGSNLGEKELELKLFDLSTIATATGKFSRTNKIGEGGFGPVYKGKLFTGQEIAVKRLSKSSGQGLKEFKNEVQLMAKLQHRNLVRLLGCCIHAEDRMLVYEYMPNRSLDYYIFDETRAASLDWQKRFDIIVGTARGLLYLHRDSRLRIIHRDLKASNILLDGDMNPKISDFGLARMFGCEQTEAKTCRVMGTYGYMSPEYAIDGQFSVKSDVFSFGVLVLEIVIGQRNREFYHPDHDLNLLGHAWKLWNQGRATEMLADPLKESLVNLSKVLKCVQVGLLCVQQRPEDRPTMSSVVLMLDSDSTSLPQPKEPAYYTVRCLLSHRRAPLHSANEVTITMLLGR